MIPREYYYHKKKEKYNKDHDMSDNSAETFEENKSEMIEDEEMPTFISVSSKDISLPYNTDGNIQLLAIDNSANNPLLLHPDNEENPGDYEARSHSATTEEREEEVNDENEDGDGSVYVLSSGDDADDHDDPSSRSYDEDVDEEEEDVDDEDDEDIDGEIFQISYYPGSDMDEIDGEEEEIGVMEDGQLLGDFSEDEMEREDVMSDDMAFRSDKPMVINNERRSQSLQDLSEYGSQTERKSFITGANKYSRVQSKVKRYIQDIKDRNRRSAQNRLKVIEDNKKSQEIQTKVSGDKKDEEYPQKSNRGRRSIKDYAKQALKDLEMREGLGQENDENMMNEKVPENCVTMPKNNWKNKGNWWTEEREHRQNDFKSGFRTAADIYRNKKMNMNGELANNDPLKNIKIPKGITLNYTTLNGQTQGQNILDVRSIGYDEYMRGNSNSSSDKHVEGIEIGKKLSQDEMQTSKLEITNIRSETQLHTELKDREDMEGIPMEVVEGQENELKALEQVSKNKIVKGEKLAEMAMIQSQLNQRTTQCKEIRQAYEKTLSENFQLKQELEDLKKTLAKLTIKKPVPQLVTVAIQTDPLPPPSKSSDETKDIQTADNLQNPKLSTSSMGSALSTNEHWTESAGSLPMSNGSIRPLPNLTPLSNAEDSFIGVTSTPPRTPRQPSHAFQTSSRIIKMLSSITQKKPKGEGNLNTGENLYNVFGKGFALASPGIPSYSSPLNHRGSNKRKASEMPENANFLQPPKIAHTSSESSRLNRTNKLEFKYPGDSNKLNSESSSADAQRSLENLENVQREDEPSDDLDSGVKCFTYRDTDNSQETSFLIQAEDEAKNQDGGKDGERSSIGIVRECGPYLLGNVEVRMTEINGTINIWGKEVSQETTIENEPEEEADIEEDLNERGACGCWHRTPNTRFSSSGPMSCSTNKKLKIPPLRLNESAFSKSHHHSPSTLESSKDRQNIKNYENDDNCRTCDPQSSNACSLNKFRRCSNFGQEEEGKINNLNNYYGCNWDNENCDNPSCGRVSRQCHRAGHSCTPSNTLNIRGTGTGRCSKLNSANDDMRFKTEENLNRNQSSRHISNYSEDDHSSTCRHGPRKDSPLDNDVFKRPSTSNTRVNNDGCCKNESCRSHSTSFNNQSTDPLLSHHTHEPPEARRRRTSGKRVRGILMDFLRGCGDCRTTNVAENKVSPSIIPHIQLRSSTPPPSLSSQTQQRTTNYGSMNKRCVHMECCTTCSKRIEMAAEIETQLEIFGAEMERLRSRSQAVLGMLNTLHSADTN